MGTLEIIFWVLLAVVIYTYIGYGFLLLIIVKVRELLRSKVTVDSTVFEPSVTLFVAAYNERSCIEEKIKNTLALDYPKDKVQILFVTDGSDDGTPEFLMEFPSVEVLHENRRGGKIGAINRGMKHVKHPIVIYSDANAMLNTSAIRHIVKHYQDPTIGCVSGEKRVCSENTSGASGAGEGMYWKYESFLKLYDYKLYSAVGAAGELFSIRTSLHKEVEQDTILDDFMISMRIAMDGYKIAYEPEAYASEEASSSIKNEMKRKIRISAGAIQSVFRLLPLFNLFKYRWLSFAFISHRFLRWTITPVFLLCLLPINFALYLASSNSVHGAILAGQILFYLMAGVGAILEKSPLKLKVFFIPFYFLFMNVCLFAGMIRFAKGKQSVLWEKARK